MNKEHEIVSGSSQCAECPLVCAIHVERKRVQGLEYDALEKAQIQAILGALVLKEVTVINKCSGYQPKNERAILRWAKRIGWQRKPALCASSDQGLTLADRSGERLRYGLDMIRRDHIIAARAKIDVSDHLTKDDTVSLTRKADHER